MFVCGPTAWYIVYDSQVLTGWDVVLVSRGLRTCVMAPEVPSMYGMVTKVVGIKGRDDG